MAEDSNDDDDFDERMDYFYDLIIRAPKTEEDFLPQLHCSRTIVVWKKRLRYLPFNSDEIDSLMDPDVVD